VDVVVDGFVVAGFAGFEEADVEDHVDFAGAVLEDADGFVALGTGERRSEGEAYEDADGDAGSGECGVREGDPSGVDHGAGKVMFGYFVADLEGVGAGGVGFEESVIEDGGEILPGGESVGCEGCCVVRWKGDGRGGAAKDGAQWCSFGSTAVDSEAVNIYEVMIPVLTSVFFLS
jgi:hypothetical protein